MSIEDDDALRERLSAVDEAIAQNDFRAANIRAGYVYVISNQGAFGGNVVKIGLTRRLEPRERIIELGGASVPSRFDTHTLFFSADAVTLEAAAMNATARYIEGSVRSPPLPIDSESRYRRLRPPEG